MKLSVRTDGINLEVWLILWIPFHRCKAVGSEFVNYESLSKKRG